jgi:hypothetical protein
LLHVETRQDPDKAAVNALKLRKAQLFNVLINWIEFSAATRSHLPLLNWNTYRILCQDWIAVKSLAVLG